MQTKTHKTYYNKLEQTLGVIGSEGCMPMELGYGFFSFFNAFKRWFQIHLYMN